MEKDGNSDELTNDDRLGINKLQNSAADFTIDTVRGRELSDNKDSEKTRIERTVLFC